MRPPSYKLTAASLRCCFLVFLGYHDLLTLTALSHRRTLIESNLAKTRAPLVHGSRGGHGPDYCKSHVRLLHHRDLRGRYTVW